MNREKDNMNSSYDNSPEAGFRSTTEALLGNRGIELAEAAEWDDYTREAFADVMAALRIHGEELAAFDGVVSVRPGYRFENARITPQPAVVVAVMRKKDLTEVRQSEIIPRKLGKVLVDVVPASPIEQAEYLRRRSSFSTADSKAPYGEVDFTLPGESEPELDAEDSFAAGLLPYQPPADASLDEINEQMSIICHSSPDTGWSTLKSFLQNTSRTLTSTMYEFNAGYILDTLISSLRVGRKLDLILDGKNSDDVPSPTRGDVSKEQVRTRLKATLDDRFTFAWAAVRSTGKTTGSFFPSAYHIKVSVRDGQSIWLSSGNWKRSNQPEEDPFDGHMSTSAQWRFLTAQGHNREWHVVIHNRSLAKMFEAFIKSDIRQALPLQIESVSFAPAEPMPDLFVPDPEIEVGFAPRPNPRFFRAQEFNKVVKVQPLLTPDNYLDHVLPLISGARRVLYFQNQSLSPKWNNARYTAAFKALRDKSNDRRMDIKIIVSEYADLGALQSAGFNMSRIKVQKDCHNKGILVDDETAVVGSHNWTGQGASENRDASLIFFDTAITSYFKDIFEYDWENLAHEESLAFFEMPRIAQPGEPNPPGMIRVGWYDYFPEWEEATQS